jgi:predicted hotdog family 3-hydroxylacyl-ACP dehydratase
LNPDQAWIAAHIPHAGSMCLLAEVAEWSQTKIVCLASSHRLAFNPLRCAGTLGITTGIEYAAQAMAVHAALLADGAEVPRVGYLTSVRDVHWRRQRLDDLACDLTVRAEKLAGDQGVAVYTFCLLAAQVVLMSGRASVLLEPEARSTQAPDRPAR